jgi:putative addiction module component (TIGR02574 family)
LWASIEDADIVLTPEQLAEIERRGKWAEANPDKCLSHEEFEARIRSLM